MKENEKAFRKEVIALSYEPTSVDAPKVIAKGKGIVAENILEKAKKHDIPIQEDPSLVELLGKLNINETIPEELYKAVAEVFAFIYQTNQAASKKLKS